MQDSCRTIAARRGVTIKTEIVNQDAPAICNPTLVSILSDACEGSPFDRMVSRAYHDSLFMSRLFPVAMLFIPCHKGYSHRPDEYASPQAIAQGALVLAKALAKAAG